MRSSPELRRVTRLLPMLLCAALQTGCDSQAVYTRESFAEDSPFKLKVDGEVEAACESARRSLLGQGYLIEKSGDEQVNGRKAYRNEDNLNTFIEMNVVCMSDNVGSTLFANGVLSTYDLKKSGNSASVGVSAVGSISLPFGQSADSLVKIAEETIDDKEFYGRFFAAVQHTLRELGSHRESKPDRWTADDVTSGVTGTSQTEPAIDKQPDRPAAPAAPGGMSVSVSVEPATVNPPSTAVQPLAPADAPAEAVPSVANEPATVEPNPPAQQPAAVPALEAFVPEGDGIPEELGPDSGPAPDTTGSSAAATVAEPVITEPEPAIAAPSEP